MYDMYSMLMLLFLLLYFNVWIVWMLYNDWMRSFTDVVRFVSFLLRANMKYCISNVENVSTLHGNEAKTTNRISFGIFRSSLS